MINVPINHKYLCGGICHRGINGPHRNKKIDLKYKQELQAKLNNIFSQEYYMPKEIKNILEISQKDVEGIVKKLPLHPEGYKTEDLIKRCLGGRLYNE